MALVVKDRVKETTSTTGTGTLTLAGAVAKFQSFSVVGDGNTTYYAIESGNGTDWEVGVGTYTASGTTLSRDTILESSNSGSAISLSGTSIVFCTYPAERSVNTADIGSTVQGYDADTAKYDDTTANFTGTLQVSGTAVVKAGDNISTLTNDAGYVTGNQTITLSGDATGSGTTAITVTVADDSHNHIISNVDGLQTALDDKAPIANPTFTGNITVNGDILVDEIRARTNQDLTITCGESFGSLTDGSFNDEIVRIAGEGGIKVYASSDNLTSGLNRETTLIDPSGNMNVSGTVTASSFSGALSGNASTATTLQTARNINGVSFNGSADITVTANTPNTLTRGSYLTGSNFDGSAATTWAVDATTTATANKVVARDVSGYVFATYYNSAGTFSTTGTASGMARFTGTNGTDTYGRSYTPAAAAAALSGQTMNIAGSSTSCTGNAATATQWATGRTISLTGDVTGTSASFDGSGNASITATVADDSHNHIISNVDGLQTALDGKADLSGASFTGNVYSTGNIGLDSTDYLTFTNNTQMDIYVNGSNEFRFEADGDFHADGDVIAYSTTTASDEKLKDNIEVVENAVDKLHQLKGVTFTWKRDNQASAGVIAQDVQKVLPEAVKEVKDMKGDTHLTVNYAALTSILIEAVKDLSEQVKELKGK